MQKFDKKFFESSPSDLTFLVEQGKFYEPERRYESLIAFVGFPKGAAKGPYSGLKLRPNS